MTKYNKENMHRGNKNRPAFIATLIDRSITPAMIPRMKIAGKQWRETILHNNKEKL
jgi:hypothetical protein